jgi:CDP-diacylglycerol--glycerol-3-phosphate 3-phosphatidyltransferase
MALGRLNLPNSITVVRILACPVLFVLLLSSRTSYLALAFGLFLLAALSDLWDGYLARKHGWITDFGKLMDPVADKLLLVATFVPFHLVSRGADPLFDVPWWGTVPLWVLVLIFGREAAVTLFRVWAAGRGTVVPAGRSGKLKAFVQNVFCGALILWYVLVRLASERGWDGFPWRAWSEFHGAVIGVLLGLAIVLTVYSLAIYYRENRALFGGYERNES